MNNEIKNKFQRFLLIERGRVDRRDKSGMIFRSNSTMPLINLEKENNDVNQVFTFFI